MVFVFYDDHFPVTRGPPSTKRDFSLCSSINRSPFGSCYIDTFMLASVTHSELGSKCTFRGPDEKTFTRFNSGRCFLFYRTRGGLIGSGYLQNTAGTGYP